MVELWREFAVGNERRRYERDRDLFTAWHAAAFVWSKKLPKLEDVLSKKKKVTTAWRGQTPGQLKAVLHILAERYEYPLKVGHES